MACDAPKPTWVQLLPASVELWICPSVTGIQLSPPSVVFQSPPPVAPKYPSFGRPLTPLMVIERPPRSGPILRHDRPLRMSAAMDDAGCGACGERAATRSIRTPAVNITPIASPRGRMRNGRRGIGKLLQRLEEFTSA